MCVCLSSPNALLPRSQWDGSKHTHTETTSLTTQPGLGNDAKRLAGSIHPSLCCVAHQKEVDVRKQDATHRVQTRSAATHLLRLRLAATSVLLLRSGSVDGGALPAAHYIRTRITLECTVPDTCTRVVIAVLRTHLSDLSRPGRSSMSESVSFTIRSTSVASDRICQGCPYARA